MFYLFLYILSLTLIITLIIYSYTHNNLALSISGILDVISGIKPSIRHFHDSSVRIATRDSGFLYLSSLNLTNIFLLAFLTCL